MNATQYVVTISSKTIRTCVGMDRAMNQSPQFVFAGMAAAEAARTVYAEKMAAFGHKFSKEKWLEQLEILPANGQIPDLACPYVRVENGVVVEL